MTTSPLYVVVGPSGVGKGTVLSKLTAAYPQLQLSVSATTRQPRPGEVDGQAYVFLSDDEFDELEESGALLESATVHGTHRYGTPAKWVQAQRDAGKTVALEIDVEGARQVRQSDPDAQLIFLAPPSWEDLEARLKGRGTETPSELEKRLATARKELAAIGEFDTVVVNDDVDSTVSKLAGLMGLK